MEDSDEQYQTRQEDNYANFSANNMVTNKYSAVTKPTKNVGRKRPQKKNIEIWRQFKLYKRADSLKEEA
jgi:hypothetical protein